MPIDRSDNSEAEAEPVDINPSWQQTDFRDGDISPQNRDSLLQMASLIRLAESFRLGFVKCNQPAQCRQMAHLLKDMLTDEAKIIILELKGPVSSLRRAVHRTVEANRLDVQGKSAILVFGFERSIPSEDPAPALDELNQSRDNFPQSFSGPLLIWLPDYALTRLAREAPDFWGWRSGVFEFSPELRVISALEKMAMDGPFSDRLGLSEKMEKASALEGLIRDYRELPSGERTDRSLAAVLHSLGIIRYLLGEHNVARRLYQESLQISRDLGDKSGVSISLHQLGMLAQDTGDLAEARRLYQESLQISRDLGDKSGVSISLHQLGTLAKNTGDLAEARRLYQESHKIFQDLGDKSGVSISLHQLGVLAQATGDLEEARRLYQESLQISRDLGDKSGVSRSLHQLGTLAKKTGDLEEARRLYQESLQISRDLGDKNGIALGLAQASLLEESVGNLNEALELIRKAESLFTELGSPTAAQAMRDRQRIGKKVR
jgi:tetratricopeptide (TPR) repeat protein